MAQPKVADKHKGVEMKRVHFNSALALTAAVLFSAGSQAGVITYSDIGSWQAATSGDVNRDFNGYSGTDSYLGTFADQGVTFSASNGYLFSQGPVSCGAGCQYGTDLGTGNYLLGPSWPDSLSASLSPGATAVGLDLALENQSAPNGYFPLTASVTVDFATGPAATYTVSFGAPEQWQFFGVSDATDAITGLTVSAPNLYPQYYCDPNVCYNGLGGPNLLVDNFATGTSGATPTVPEPSTWALTLLGLCGLGFVAYGRRHRGSSRPA